MQVRLRLSSSQYYSDGIIKTPLFSSSSIALISVSGILGNIVETLQQHRKNEEEEHTATKTCFD